MRRAMLPILLAAALAAGCLVRETTHTWYFEADGSVTWRILDEDVRSDAGTASERWDDEREFLDRVESGASIEVLRRLGATWVDVRFLRDHRPYTVLTEASFPSAEILVRELLWQSGLIGDAELTTEGGVRRLEVVFAAEEDEERAETEAAEELADLLSSMSELRIIPARGWFLDAVGFALEDGDTRASPSWSDGDETALEREAAFLCLVWTSEPEAQEPALGCGGEWMP